MEITRISRPDAGTTLGTELWTTVGCCGAPAVIGSVLGRDLEAHRHCHFGVEVHRELVEADVLGDLALDLLAVDVDADLVGKGGGHLGAADGAVEPALFGRLGAGSQQDPRQLGGGRLGVGPVLGGLQGGEAPLDVVVAAPPAAAADAPEVPEVDAPEVVVLAGARIAPTAAALERSAGAETPAGSGATSAPAPSTPASSPGSDQPSDPPSTGTPAPGTPTQPEPEPEPEPEPQTPPLDVAVDTETGSITVTVGLLGEPIVISTPPLVVNNR